ncbi:MAG: MMPL family transporter, partial [Gammaproteobacteria bacterium]|nr:MMPL family transporter [Gammaproteobacteria bacterium]
KPGISMLVLKKSDADIIDTVDRIHDYIDNISKQYGEDVSISSFQDFSKFTRMRLGVLTSNGKVGLLLVFISLILFLRFSVAMMTTIGLPIIFMSGLFMLYMAGITLNLISMMGFIMVLGMLVDDAILIGENITYHMEKGMAPKKAAVHGAMELMGPVTASILTTIAAFVPMMFMSGIIGKFVIAIPIVVIMMLALSWLESFFLLPSHVAHFTNPNKHPKERGWLLALDTVYSKILTIALRFRWITVGLSVAVLFFSFALAKTMPFQLFPAAGVDEFMVRVTAAPGTSLKAMRDNLRIVDRALRNNLTTEHLQATLLTAGEIAADQGDPLTQRGSRYGQIRAIYTPAVGRPDHDVIDEMHAAERIITTQFPEFEIAFTAVQPGPPLGRALEAEISSSDEETSNRAARRLMDYLNTVKGVTSVDSGLKRGDDEIHVVMDRELATYAGVNLAAASSIVRAASGGLVVSYVHKGSEEVDITIRYPESEQGGLDNLKSIQIPNRRDGLVPLSKIAHFEVKEGFTTIRHKDAIRIINVTADINADTITSKALNSLVKENQSEWIGDLADSVSVNYGGEEEKNNESARSLAVAFIFALIGIFFILAMQFNNLIYPLVVMLAIPFGAIGIILSIYLHDIYWMPMPLSFFSMLGMVALTGVVVNSSLILLVFIQRALKDGVEVIEAIITAGRRRLRAVLLTATTTVVGLLPTAYGWGGSDHFVQPIALALSSGLIFATVVTLISIPATFAVGVDIKNLFNKIFRRGKQPA